MGAGPAAGEREARGIIPLLRLSRCSRRCGCGALSRRRSAQHTCTSHCSDAACVLLCLYLALCTGLRCPVQPSRPLAAAPSRHARGALGARTRALPCACLHGTLLQAAHCHPPHSPGDYLLAERCKLVHARAFLIACEYDSVSAAAGTSVSTSGMPSPMRHLRHPCARLTADRDAGRCTCRSTVCSLEECAPPSPPSRQPRQSRRPGCRAARSRRR